MNAAVLASLITGHAAEYKINPKKMTWQEHETEAVTWGGHLTSISSLDEQQHILQICRDKGVGVGQGQGIWCGAKRIEVQEGEGSHGQRSWGLERR